MYGRSASSGVESMYHANKLVSEKMAINILNAAILLFNLEGEHYHLWKGMAWLRNFPFTPRGMEIMNEVFEDVNTSEFRLSFEEDMTCYTVSTSKNATCLRNLSLA
jgi:hypothetical protein